MQSWIILPTTFLSSVLVSRSALSHFVHFRATFIWPSEYHVVASLMNAFKRGLMEDLLRLTTSTISIESSYAILLVGMQKLWCEISPNKLSITINDEVSNQIDSTDIFCRGFWFPEAPINSHAHKSDVAEFSLRVGGKKFFLLITN